MTLAMDRIDLGDRKSMDGMRRVFCSKIPRVVRPEKSLALATHGKSERLRMDGASSRPIRLTFFWAVVGNIYYSACQAGLLILIARLGNVDMVGQFALGLALCTPILTFTGLQLRTVYVQDVLNAWSLKQFLTLRLMTVSVSFACVTIVAFSIEANVSSIAVLVGLGWVRSCEAISDLLYGVLQRNDRMDRISYSLCLRGTLSIATLAGFLVATGSLHLAVFGMAAVSTFMMLIDFHCAVRKCGQRSLTSGVYSGTADPFIDHARNTLISLVWKALPLGIISALLAVNANLPRYFIDGVLGQRELGIFASLSAPALAMSTVVTSLGNSICAHLARYDALGNKRAFARIVVKAVLLATAFGFSGLLLAILFGQPLLELLFGPEFASRSDVFSWIMAANVAWSIALILGCGITATPIARHQVWVLGVVIVIMTIAFYPAAKSFGLLGVAGVIAVAASLIAVSYAGLLAFYCNCQSEHLTLNAHRHLKNVA